MNANHVSRRNLVNLYRMGIRKLCEGLARSRRPDTTLIAALSISADYLDKALRRIQELEAQEMEQAELEEGR